MSKIVKMATTPDEAQKQALDAYHKERDYFYREIQRQEEQGLTTDPRVIFHGAQSVSGEW